MDRSTSGSSILAYAGIKSKANKTLNLIVQATSDYLVLLPRQRSGEVIILGSESRSQGAGPQAVDVNDTAQSDVSGWPHEAVCMHQQIEHNQLKL